MTNIVRKRGDTYADEFVFKSAKTKAPLNITGYSFLLTVDTRKDPPDETTRVYQIVGAITAASAGRVEFAPTESQANQVGEFFYDVQMVDGAGRKRTPIAAKYKYEQDITK